MPYFHASYILETKRGKTAPDTAGYCPKCGSKWWVHFRETGQTKVVGKCLDCHHVEGVKSDYSEYMRQRGGGNREPIRNMGLSNWVPCWLNYKQDGLLNAST
jgi:hypothetical protein